MSIVFPDFSLICIVGEKPLWRGRTNWTRFRRLIGNSLRAGNASLLLWPTTTMSHSRRLNRQERHFDWVPQWFSAYLPATAGSVVPVSLCSNHSGANAAAESSTRASRKSFRRRSRTSTYGEKTIAGKPASRSSAGVSPGRHDAFVIQGDSVPRSRLRSTGGNYATPGSKASGSTALPCKGRIACEGTAPTPANEATPDDKPVPVASDSKPSTPDIKSCRSLWNDSSGRPICTRAVGNSGTVR
jgi:hypothetical protein